ncbi:hypothetical protein ElyMa_005895500, partial [Elysia marginata]
MTDYFRRTTSVRFPNIFSKFFTLTTDYASLETPRTYTSGDTATVGPGLSCINYVCVAVCLSAGRTATVGLGLSCINYVWYELLYGQYRTADVRDVAAILVLDSVILIPVTLTILIC